MTFDLSVIVIVRRQKNVAVGSQELVVAVLYRHVLGHGQIFYIFWSRQTVTGSRHLKFVLLRIVAAGMCMQIRECDAIARYKTAETPQTNLRTKTPKPGTFFWQHFYVHERFNDQLALYIHVESD